MHARALFCLALAAAAAFLAPRASLAEGLSEARCRLATDQLPAAFARCGMLEVPEDPSAPDGANVELFVARVAAATSTPQLDPLLLIAGGPGQSTVDFYLQLRGAFEPVRRQRDLILVDQRGTGRSAEGFSCSVPDDLALDTAPPAELQAFIDGCVAELEHDPRFYTTSVAVADLERVRAWLGIERWNVYGVSYGTRVAQHYLRRFPERTRAIVLDGVVPPALALGPDVALEAQRALDRIFERCRGDAGCAERFPNLPDEFAALLARLEQSPVVREPAGGRPAGGADGGSGGSRDNGAEGDSGGDSGGSSSDSSGGSADGSADGGSRGGERFGAQELRAVVRFMSYSGATTALLPVLLHEAHGGHYEPLMRQASTLLRDLPESLSFAMSNSVLCTEDVPFVAADADDALASTYLGTTLFESLQLICSHWPKGAIDADFKAPLSSAHPVLLLSGSNDPITPPAYAEAAAARLPNSVHLVGRGQGHGLLPVGCVPRLLSRFLDNPGPDAVASDCLEVEPPTPFFLSLLGPAP